MEDQHDPETCPRCGVQTDAPEGRLCTACEHDDEQAHLDRERQRLWDAMTDRERDDAIKWAMYNPG